MDIATRMQLIERPPTEEVITHEDLQELLETNTKPNHYIGYEISGLLHLGSLVLPGLKIKDFIDAGCRSTVFLADWHSWINKKFGGDLEAIKAAAKYYKEAFRLVSPDIRVVLGSELYKSKPDFWADVIKVAERTTMQRIMRTLTIMGRKESETLTAAQLFYPAMQAADMKALDVDIAHAGMDQRKVHMLARDVFPKLGWETPVAVHHRLLPGLLKPQRQGFEEDSALDLAISAKMSKSKPWTCIFIHDGKDVIAHKMAEAWCPPKQVENNGILEMAKYLVFRIFDETEVKRERRFGGDVTYHDYQELEKAYRMGALHPSDLKKAMVGYLDKIVAPYRKHFEKKSKAELLKVFAKAKVTR